MSLPRFRFEQNRINRSRTKKTKKKKKIQISKEPPSVSPPFRLGGYVGNKKHFPCQSHVARFNATASNRRRSRRRPVNWYILIRREGHPGDRGGAR